MWKIIPIFKTRKKTKFLYTLFFSIVILVVYLHNTTLNHDSYNPFQSLGKQRNFLTFISSKFATKNESLYFEGYFENESSSEISVLRIKNLTFLSKLYKQWGSILKLQKKQSAFYFTEESKRNKDYNATAVQTLPLQSRRKQNAVFKWNSTHNLTPQKDRNFNISPVTILQKQFTLTTQDQKQRNENLKWQKGQVLASAERNKRKEMILKWQEENNLTSHWHYSVNSERPKIQEKIENYTKPGKVTSCPGFDSYSISKELSESEKREFNDWQQFEQNRVVKDVNCRLLFDDNQNEQNKTRKLMRQPFKEVLPHLYVNKTKNCAPYIKNMGYITSSLTQEEEDFPIAYSILVFKGIEQVETLLRAIYRPQNVYCIHCDTKADKDFKRALHSIAGCFENVFISTKSFNVGWGTIGVLLPELACMRDLWKHRKWKYLINLTGQEFPLRTNYELVKILKIYNGANDMESTLKRADKSRWTDLPKPPHNIQPVKGSVHIVASRGYVEYLLHNEIAKDFFNWTRGVKVPDEVFFSTLNHNPHLGIPGSYKGVPETNCETKPFLARFKNWGNHIYNWTCHGTRVRLVCVFGIGDLPLLSLRPEMFANKFYLHYQPYTYQCMDELIFNRTRDEYFNVLKFDTKKYQLLEFIKDSI